jgi:LSD1 subclass zinc finger protein
MSSITYISMTFSISAANTTLMLPMTNFTGTIDWGDGNTQVYSSLITNPSKLYTNSGTYIVNIMDVTSLTVFGSSGSFPIYNNSLTNFSYLINISTLTNLNNLFFKCNQNFTINFASNVTSNVTNMSSMFRETTTFNQPITLDCSSCTTLHQFLRGATGATGATAFNSSVSLTNTSKVQNMSGMFNLATSFNQPITLDCSSCTNLIAILNGATAFNSSLNLTNTSKVQNMSFMFNSATTFNKPITLDCSSCTTLQSFLAGATAFNSSVSLTNTLKVQNMQGMFFEATNFNSSLSFLTNTSNVISMRSMFGFATSFNQPITLDCSSCTTLFQFLRGATTFNSSVSLTNTSKVQDMAFMFNSATTFNQPITLDCSSCTRIQDFLQGATAFNSSVSLTNTSKVTNMIRMFYNATTFNQPITLDCSSCTILQGFLQGATAFNNSLNLTPIPNLSNATDMIVNTSLSTTNYSNLLTLWGSQPVLKPNVTLTATGVNYNTSAQSYRTTLVSSPNNWNIIDGGISYDWRFFYLYDIEQGKYYFPLISPQNQSDGQIFTQTFNTFGRIFTIKQGYPVQGIFKFDIYVNDNKPFKFGAYGNIGSDSNENISYLTYPYSIGSTNLTLYYVKQQEIGDNDEIIYSYFIPKKVSENNNQTYNLYQQPGQYNNSLMSKEVTNGLIVYFSKTNDVKEWVVNDLGVQS